MQAEDAQPDTLSQPRVAEFLAARLGGEISRVEPIGHGEWSRAFTFTRGTADYVVRFSRFDADFRKDQLAASWSSAELPIPRILEIGQAFDGYYAISERAPGMFLDGLELGAMRRILPPLFRTLDAVRQVDLSNTRGFGLWSGDGRAPCATWSEALLDMTRDSPSHRTAGWRARLETSPTGSGPFDEALGRVTPLLASLPHSRSLVHSDLLNFNVLVDEDRISAVIDWGSALFGDFVWDIAWFVFWQPWYPAWEKLDFAAEARRHYASMGLNVPEFDSRLRCYATFIGLDNQAYSAFKGRWAQLDQVARRTLAFATSALA